MLTTEHNRLSGGRQTAWKTMTRPGREKSSLTAEGLQSTPAEGEKQGSSPAELYPRESIYTEMME